jgi:hypothetical protein
VKKREEIFSIISIMHFLLILTISSFSYYYDKTTLALQVGEPNPEPRNPFSFSDGAPSISMKYGNDTYTGELRSAAFSYGDVNNNLESFENNSSDITSIIPDRTLNISQGKQIQLLISGNPTPENQPNTLSATAYHTNGTQVKVLTIAEDGKKDNFIIDLERGQYLILSVATWLPTSDNYLTSSGYISYVFRVNVY